MNLKAKKDNSEALDLDKKLGAIFPVKRDKQTMEWIKEMKQMGHDIVELSLKEELGMHNVFFALVICSRERYTKLIYSAVPIPLELIEDLCDPLADELKALF